MSDPIKHECGVAIVRLKKPLNYYREKYGTAQWGLNKLYLLMEKQRNRGQDGAGVGVVKLDMDPGQQYMARHREAGSGSLDRVWNKIHQDMSSLQANGHSDKELKENHSWLGEIYMGHLRYGTHGGNEINVCHPFVRDSNWATRRMMVAGNFTLTNTSEIFDLLVSLGQHPMGSVDTVTVMEKIGHFLDVANEAIYHKLKAKTNLVGQELVKELGKQIDLVRVLRHASKPWDGGHFMCGAIGHGSCFAYRDPHGIRPGFYYENDEVFACASERVALVTCFSQDSSQIKEVKPGHAIIIDPDGKVEELQVKEPEKNAQCTFERIYFSRGNDKDIYRERKALGFELAGAVLEAAERDLSKIVVSYVPNTAEVSYYGLLEGLEDKLADWRVQKIKDLYANDNASDENLRAILSQHVRQEKLAQKDAKLRTFISEENGRGELVRHAYDITRGIIKKHEDNLVIIDDSIVRGTTLRESILSMLAYLEPKRIIVVSSAPQIRYPDCYGIDMSELGKFIAFEAAVTLLMENGKEDILKSCYENCLEYMQSGSREMVNHVQPIFKEFTGIEISNKIAQLITPDNTPFTGEIVVIYQNIEGLRKAIPNHHGDWYFTGNYPTVGGYRVVNQAFVNYYEKKTGRAY
ncbi:MAG: amidophosphoribosyltransferase [Planctomycetes bacterium]|nr:amidophosphoribosyltransferase [Planctomycetota bacterium]